MLNPVSIGADFCFDSTKMRGFVLFYHMLRRDDFKSIRGMIMKNAWKSPLFSHFDPRAAVTWKKIVKFANEKAVLINHISFFYIYPDGKNRK